MGTRLKTEDSVDVLHFPGTLDAFQMLRLRPRLTRLLNRHPRLLVLDLAETREVKLAGLGMLVDRLRRSSNGTGFRIENASPRVFQTLARAGVNGFLAS
ncbi:MAG: STAS domain-containing protein [Candidatus Omnitrophica bacterium]|nr:STAS domain-containing protein [Candidatus Omnitrophota bacterium]